MSRKPTKSPPSLGYWDTPSFRIRFAECFVGEAKRDAQLAAILAGALPGKERLAAKVALQDPVVLKEIDELCQVARASSILSLSDCLAILAGVARGEVGTTEERDTPKGYVTIKRVSARDIVAATREYARLAGYVDDEGSTVNLHVGGTGDGGGIRIQIPHNGRDDLAKLGHVTVHALPAAEPDSEDESIIDVAGHEVAG